MKTEAPAPAANLTVAQLGQVLAKSKTASPDPKKSAASPAAPTPSREPASPEEGERTEDEPTALSQTESENPDEAEEGEGQEARGDSPPETEAPEQPENPEAPQATDQPEQPASVSDAVLNRINQDLGPLISELTKAGAKGALQILQKRIPKLVDQRDTERNGRLSAEQRVTELETELETAKTAETQDARPETRTAHPAVAKLNQSLGEVDGFIRLFKANPDGVEISDGEGGKVMLTPEEVSEHLDKLKDRRTELLAERKVTEQTVAENFRVEHSKFNTIAERVYPWMAKTDAPEQGRMKKILELVPELKRLPDYKLIVGHYVRGEAAAVAELKAKGQKPVTRKAPAPTEPTKVATETPSGKAGPADEVSKAKKAVKDAEDQFKKSGKAADMTKLESAKRALARLQK